MKSIFLPKIYTADIHKKDQAQSINYQQPS